MRPILLGVIALTFFSYLPSKEKLHKVNHSPSIETLYSSLDPKSIMENLTFYKLYPKSPFGKKAYKRAFRLLTGGKRPGLALDLPNIDISILVNMVQKKPLEDIGDVSEETIATIEDIAQDLGNRMLVGHNFWTKKEILEADPDDIDLSRALFLSEFDYDLTLKKKIRYYEASIDLMALQILAKLSDRPTNEEKIRKINDFIFHQMQFRFPPHSLYAKNIDTYTFLPSVIDNRKGVCLGVSLLYQCIAQRLNLHLQSITPPGHIYVRYKRGDKIINIETTARGIDLPTEQYLGIETLCLQERNRKELIGLAFMNQASVFWHKEDYKKAVSLYEKALDYIEDDHLLLELYAYNLLFVGDEKGRKILNSLKNRPIRYLLSEKKLLLDFLAGKTSIEGIQAIFMHVDETRESIHQKKQALEDVLEKYPYFQAGLIQLASTHLQLLEEKKALKTLKRCFDLSPKEPIVNYYLSIIFMERTHYKKAWEHFLKLESSLKNYNLFSKPLKNYRRMLMQKSPLFSMGQEKQSRKIANI